MVTVGEIVMLLTVCIIVLMCVIAHRIINRHNRNYYNSLRYKFEQPFKYPYYICEFDVSGKRNPKIDKLLEEFLIGNFKLIQYHQLRIEKWKEDCENQIQQIQDNALKEYRQMQYNWVLDDENAFNFNLVRYLTRYKQRNYMVESYKSKVIIDSFAFSYNYLQSIQHQLVNETKDKNEESSEKIASNQESVKQINRERANLIKDQLTKLIYMNLGAGNDFENAIQSLLQTCGLKADIVGKSGDKGVDIITTEIRAGLSRKFYIQCKYVNHNLGLRPVQEIYAGCKLYGGEGFPVVITNSQITEQSREAAEQLGVEIIAKPEWEELITAISQETTLQFDNNSLKCAIFRSIYQK